MHTNPRRGDDADPLAQVRQRAHQVLDSWIDDMVPLLSGDKPPTLAQLSRHMSQSRAQLMGGCLQAVLDHIQAKYANLRRISAPCCGKVLYRKRMEPKELSTLHGQAQLMRPYFYCADCHQGFLPLDEALELAREVHQYDLQQEFAQLTAELPYSCAAEQLRRLTGISVGEHALHDNVNRIAEQIRIEDVIPLRSEIQRCIERARPPDGQLPVLVVAVDGAHSPVRPPGGRKDKRGPGYWRETKGFRLYLIGPDERIVSVASWHQIESAEQLTQDLQLAAQRVPLDRVRVALVGDGAAWVWNAMEGSFPEAHEVLDYYHCAEHVWIVANARYGHLTPEAHAWAEATLTRLSMGCLPDVIAGLRRMQPTDDAAREEIAKLIAYLEEHRHRVDYDQFKNQGLPRGSGGIESANKFLVHARLKRSGAWWLEPNGNGMLRLRCAIYNGTFDRVFKKYVANRRNKSSI